MNLEIPLIVAEIALAAHLLGNLDDPPTTIGTNRYVPPIYKWKEFPSSKWKIRNNLSLYVKIITGIRAISAYSRLPTDGHKTFGYQTGP